MPYDTLFEGFGFAGKIILLNVLIGVFVFLWACLFIVPGIIAAYRYRFALYNLCENPELGVMEALAMSKAQTKGYKLDLFVLDVTFLGWSLLCALTAGILTIWVAPYVQQTNLAYFDAIKAEKGIGSLPGEESAEDDTTPVARFSVACSFFRCEDDRLCGCTFGDQFTATLCDKGSLGLLVALDDRSWFDGEFSAICNIYPSLEEISAFLQSLLACENEFLVAVSDLCSVGVLLVVSFEENVVASLKTTIGSPLVLGSATSITLVVTAATAQHGRCCENAYASH